ncbi:MAG: glycosyltransferase family 2 protein [Chloroflexota bacterium]
MLVSIVIPVHNAQSHLPHCLNAIQQTHYPNWECILVDDGSTDNSVDIIQQHDKLQLIATDSQSGPALARNLGAQKAAGELLLFIDADVMVQPGTVGHAVATMQANPQLAACFGSYDDNPSEQNLLSQYRNLQHHYVHQTSENDASTFWSGCGMIRAHIFEELGGFNTLTPGRPSIEDIELGQRLKQAGYSIQLEKLLLVKHLKHWTLGTVLQTDIRDRAWPWTRLIVQEGNIPNDLNLQISQRLSTLALFAGVLLLLLGVLQPYIWLGLFPIMGILFWLNRPFYTFLQEKRGVGFLLRAVWIHWLYFLYSGLTFGVGVIYWGAFRREFLSK